MRAVSDKNTVCSDEDCHSTMRYSLALIAVLVLALIVRIDVAFERDGWPSLAEEAEWERAALVYESVGLLASYDVAARPPLYPLFVSANYSVFGGRPLVGRVIQACLGCLTCWVAFQLGRKTLGRRTGLVAAGLCAVHPAFVFYAGILISDTLFIFLIALTMTAALGFSEPVVTRDSRRDHLRPLKAWWVFARLVDC